MVIDTREQPVEEVRVPVHEKLNFDDSSLNYSNSQPITFTRYVIKRKQESIMKSRGVQLFRVISM